MKSEARDVAMYLAGVPAERREAMTRLRSLYASAFKGCEETMDYGMQASRWLGEGAAADEIGPCQRRG